VPKSGQRWEPAFLSRSALLAVFRTLAEPLVSGESWPSLDAYTELCERHRQSRAPHLEAVSFALQAARPRRARRERIELAQLYEGSIAIERRVPCLRESDHELFNALAWAAVPRAKRVVHARQFRALCGWLPAGAARLPNRRTREQDALALFDEGGAVLVLSEACARMAQSSDFEQLTALLEAGAARIVLFGHALMEHVCFERSPVRSAALVVYAPAARLPEELALLDLVDTALATRLSEPGTLLTPDFDAALSIEPPDLAHA
jgi:hypothetical protein